MNPIILDERLSAAAELAREALAGREAPVAADVGCDHGFLTAKLLEIVPGLTMLASDVSAPSLEKARRLLGARGLSERANITVADGLSAVDRPVDAVMILGMGAGTILKIVAEGREKIGGAALIVQANVDLPLLRGGLAELGFTIQKEVYCRAAGRHYVTMLARAGEAEMPDERRLMLGACADGVQTAAQYDYLAWQRGVRVREMLLQAGTDTPRAKERLLAGGHELNRIAEAIGMNTCTVSDIERLIGEIAPFELAEEWDNVGLLFGRRNAEVTRVVVALDLTQAAVDKAKALGAQMIVTHHPIMFGAVKRVTDETREGRLMLDMGQAGISHAAAHTNLDAAQGGVNDTLMRVMGAENVRGEGFVRVGDVPEGTTFGQLCARAQKKLHAAVRAFGNAEMPVHALGCCSGAGGSEIGEALALGADCFITGEVRHHEALDALDRGCCIIEAGHFETENPVCEVLADALQKAADALQYNVTVFCLKDDPFGR